MMNYDEHKTILIVSDDYDFRREYRHLLEIEGYRIVEAEGRLDAMRMLEHCHFDLAIVGLMMEESDSGFTLCHAISRAHPGTLVIIVTGVAQNSEFEFDVSTEEERTWIKADVLLEKPIRFEQLLVEIRRLLREEAPVTA